MRRYLPFAVGLACLTGLLVACFGRVLFLGEQFSFRDAGHFYYPLYLKVQQEWQAGRLPLWSPEENSGMPLLGNPTAAVLYPGKILYAIFPYAWGARLYTIAHCLLAVAGMYGLMRSWSVSRPGAGLSALSYGFGVPVLFQYCNIIYLVGAAWIPFGLWAADRWVRLGKRGAIAQLALVLAMQTLGGEPQSAYVIGLCAGGYALALAWQRRGLPNWSMASVAFSSLVLVAVWSVLTLAGAWYFPTFRAKGPPPLPLPWMSWVRIGIGVVWGVMGFGLIRLWMRGKRTALGPALAGLTGSAILGACLAGAQLLPVLEFTSLTLRASTDAPHEMYEFSVEPLRIFEWAWPNLYGEQLQGHRSWLSAVPPHAHARMWVPSLYVGGLILVLALCGARIRNVTAWQGWLLGIAVLSFAAGLGEFTSPIFYARQIPAVASGIGPSDSAEDSWIRHDGYLRDGDGSFYWFLSMILPGFRGFRYPSKFITFTSLALAGLAGVGWDRCTQGRGRRAIVWAVALVAISGAALAAAFAARRQFVDWLERQPLGKTISLFGPFDAPGAWIDLRNALLQGLVIYTGCAVVVILAVRHRRLAGGLALVLLSTDLAIANSRYIFSIPQSEFEAIPRVLKVIEEAERKHPASGPYRIHRMKVWEPPIFYKTRSPNRVHEFTKWEFDTIQPKHGLPFGVEYTVTEGTAELFDYEFFFSPWETQIDREKLKAWMALKPGEPLVYHPRRGYDLWNTRYFILPRNVANNQDRGIASFLQNVEHIEPVPGALSGPGAREREIEWSNKEDWQVVRNRAAYPRAWVVHQIRNSRPISGMIRADRQKIMEDILYPDDFFWHSPTRFLYDPHTMAWVEADDASLTAYSPGGEADPAETVRFISNTPKRVEIEADLKRPGLVILADVYYPGWELTIDGQPAPIHRANRLMRGAAVLSGKHHLVYAYRPQSLRIGAVLSFAGIIGVMGVGAWARLRPVGRRARKAVVEELTVGV
jgi:hypothetical protein